MQGYYTKGDDDIERIYNHSSEKKYSFNNNRTIAMNHMPVSDHNRTLLPVNDTKNAFQGAYACL